MKQRDFWVNTTEVGECVEWLGRYGTTGHPEFYAGKANRHRYKLVRREVWQSIERKSLDHGIRLAMKCNNRRCVKFEHMTPMTIGEIARLAAQRGAFSTASRRAAIAFGNQTKRAKLTIDQVRMIRASTESCKTLGPKLGINPSMVSRIRRNEAWREAAPNASVFTMVA